MSNLVKTKFFNYTRLANALLLLRKEPSDWLTESRDSAVRADVQTKTGLFSGVQSCSETGTIYSVSMHLAD